MKKLELVYRELLFQAMEKQTKTLTQSYLAKSLNLSLSTVNLAIKPLVRMNAVKINVRNLNVIDVKKVLYYWASIRNLEKDVFFMTRIDEPIKEIEKQMPDSIVFTAYSAYKLKFNDVPADYSEMYVYCTEEIKKRWKENKKNPNCFVLQKDQTIEQYGKVVTTANLFVDLWNIKTWYAKDFLIALEGKIGRVLE